MIKVGITGGIGSGKSFVCDLIAKKFNVLVYNSDIRGRILMENNPEVICNIIKTFGPDSYFYNNKNSKPFTLNTEKFKELLFVNEDARNTMNSIIRNFVRKEFESFCELFKTDPFILFESAILFEPIKITDQINKFTDFNILVTATKKLRIERLLKRGLTEEDIENRIKCQPAEEWNKQYANYVIENYGDQNKLIKDINNIYKKILKYEKD